MQEKWTKDNCIEMGLKEWENQIDRMHSILFKESAATAWSELRIHLDGASYVVVEHLMKIFYFRNYEYYIRGWIVTCYKYFTKVPICKANNRPPKKEVMYECLFGNKEDAFEGWHNATVKNFNYEMEHLPKIKRICSDEVYNFCQDYMVWVSYMLCEKQEEVTEVSAYLAIQDLLEKYPLPKGVF